jgi:hypothetical protein
MDSEAVYAMAPAAAQLMIAGAGCNEDQSLLDAALAVLTGNGAHPRASIVSNSWQIPLGEVGMTRASDSGLAAAPAWRRRWSPVSSPTPSRARSQPSASSTR